MKKILIIEDDATLRQELVEMFQYHGFTTFAAGDGAAGLEAVEHHNPSLVILDIMLPGLDGYEICKRIRRRDEGTPILMLTARDQESDKLLGFALGADDYLTKPFSLRELVARVQALLKRASPAAEARAVIRIGTAEVRLRRFEIERAGQIYDLTPKEAAILKLLVEHSPEVVDRNRIIDEVWGDEYNPSPRTIDNFVLKLRQKIETDPARPQYLITVHGAGYKLIL